MQNGPEAPLEALLFRGLDPNIKDEAGTPLWFTPIRIHRMRVLEKIVAAPGFDPTATDAEGNTGLHNAVQSQNIAAVLLYMHYSSRVDANARNTAGFSALHIALRIPSAAQPSLLEALLRFNGINVEERFPDGSTPLQYAVQNGSAYSVAALLGAGAKTSVLSREGKTLLQLAQDRKDASVLLALKSKELK